MGRYIGRRSTLLIVVLSLLTTASVSKPRPQLGEPSSGEARSLRGDDIPEYFLARMFLDSVHDAASRSAAELERLLAPYGIPEGSRLRALLVREATLVAEATAPERNSYEPTDFESQADFEKYNFLQVKRTARVVGESWGRFLSEARAAGRDPEALVDAIRYHFGDGLSLMYGGEGVESALERIFATQASFQRVKDQVLRNTPRNR